MKKPLAILRAAGSKPRRDDQELIPILLYANCGSSIHIPKTPISEQSGRRLRMVRIRSHKLTGRKEKATDHISRSRKQSARRPSGQYSAPAALICGSSIHIPKQTFYGYRYNIIADKFGGTI